MRIITIMLLIVLMLVLIINRLQVVADVDDPHTHKTLHLKVVRSKAGKALHKPVLKS